VSATVFVFDRLEPKTTLRCRLVQSCCRYNVRAPDVGFGPNANSGLCMPRFRPEPKSRRRPSVPGGTKILAGFGPDDDRRGRRTGFDTTWSYARCYEASQAQMKSDLSLGYIRKPTCGGGPFARLPLWVNFDRNELSALLPVHSDERTSPDRPGWSGWCQELK
jgi:hypothetical protein